MRRGRHSLIFNDFTIYYYVTIPSKYFVKDLSLQCPPGRSSLPPTLEPVAPYLSSQAYPPSQEIFADDCTGNAWRVPGSGISPGAYLALQANRECAVESREAAKECRRHQPLMRCRWSKPERNWFLRASVTQWRKGL